MRVELAVLIRGVIISCVDLISPPSTSYRKSR